MVLAVGAFAPATSQLSSIGEAVARGAGMLEEWWYGRREANHDEAISGSASEEGKWRIVLSEMMPSAPCSALFFPRRHR